MNKKGVQRHIKQGDFFVGLLDRLLGICYDVTLYKFRSCKILKQRRQNGKSFTVNIWFSGLFIVGRKQSYHFSLHKQK